MVYQNVTMIHIQENRNISRTILRSRTRVNNGKRIHIINSCQEKPNEWKNRHTQINRVLLLALTPLGTGDVKKVAKSDKANLNTLYIFVCLSKLTLELLYSHWFFSAQHFYTPDVFALAYHYFLSTIDNALVVVIWWNLSIMDTLGSDI